MELTVRNVNEAFSEVWWKFQTYGVTETSRNGPVKVMPGAFSTIYDRPRERVLFNAHRDANPVFHLVETIWMLAGRNDVGALLPYNANYKNFAEANGIIHGGYGRRWRGWFGKDQIMDVVTELTKSPNSRRAVMGMWDSTCDLAGWADTPCNTHIYFDLRGGVLNMTVCCRSNDVLWGAYGANVVHFSMLQELIAAALKVQLGTYTQFSNNFHAYYGTASNFLDAPILGTDYMVYQRNSNLIVDMVGPKEDWGVFLEDCQRFFHGRELKTNFMRNVVEPLSDAYLKRKAKDFEASDLALGRCLGSDWKLAFTEWKERRNVGK